MFFLSVLPKSSEVQGSEHGTYIGFPTPYLSSELCACSGSPINKFQYLLSDSPYRVTLAQYPFFFSPSIRGFFFI